MAEVVLEGVTKVYSSGVPAVRGLDLRVRDGEFMVLVGPSGCGKTTTLRMVAGLEEVTAGTIRIGGRVVNGVPPRERDVAMVFQNYALYPHMTVRGNLKFALKARKLARGEIDARVRRAAEALGIDGLLSRRPAQLSGGQRQRVALGRVIVRKPRVFLLDEPLSNLDAALRIEMRAELKRIRRRLATTTIYVTHDQEEAMTLGDRIAVMKDGVVRQVGGPLEVYDRPASRFVAGFVGTPPMNFLEGRVVAADGGMFFESPGVRLRLPERLGCNLSPREAKDVILGVRPEAMAPDNEGRFAGADNVLAVTVSFVEPLGEKMDLYAATNRSPIVARIDARRDLQVAQRVNLHIDMRRAHLFEPGDDGANLTADAIME